MLWFLGKKTMNCDDQKILLLLLDPQVPGMHLLCAQFDHLCLKELEAFQKCNDREHNPEPMSQQQG